jgi:hypothetical protein
VSAPAAAATPTAIAGCHGHGPAAASGPLSPGLPTGTAQGESGPVAEATGEMVLSTDDLRAVAAFAAASARDVLRLVEEASPDDARPRAAVEAACAFAEGGRRGKPLRDTAWAALRAAQEAATPAAGEAARAAMAAAGAAYLHPHADAHPVKHVLGAAAHAARAAELAAGGDPAVGTAHVQRAAQRASPAVVEVLLRYPAAPSGGGRVGELTRVLDDALRGS